MTVAGAGGQDQGKGAAGNQTSGRFVEGLAL